MESGWRKLRIKCVVVERDRSLVNKRMAMRAFNQCVQARYGRKPKRCVSAIVFMFDPRKKRFLF